MSAHLLIIHFPVAVTLLAALVDLVGAAGGNAALRVRAGQLLMIAGLTTFLAFATGEGARLSAMMGGEMDLERLTIHEQWGSVGTWVIVGGAMARGVWRHRFDGAMAWVNLLVAVGLAVLAIAITVTGTLVRH